MNAIEPSIPEAPNWELTEYERETWWYENAFDAGWAEGWAKGWAEGWVKGYVEGQRKLLRVAIESRGFELTDEQRARIEACADEAQLVGWMRRLFRVDTAEALFADAD